MTPQASYPNKKFYVYILFRENGQPFYVGKGSNNRWKGHEKDAKYLDSYKDRIVRKMVRESQEIRRIKFAEGLAESTAFFLESFLIKKLGRYPNGPLANATDGGEGVSNPSPEVRAKISAAHKGNKYCAGKTITPEQIALMTEGRRKKGYLKETYDKVAEKLRGKNHSIEHKEKISSSMKGKKFTEEHRANIATAKRRENLSAETLRKRSESLKGKGKTEESRKKMRASRLRFLEEHNTPEDIEARRKAASVASTERWRVRRLREAGLWPN